MKQRGLARAVPLAGWITLLASPAAARPHERPPTPGGPTVATEKAVGAAAPALFRPGPTAADISGSRPRPRPIPTSAAFLGTPDDELLHRLCELPVTKLVYNYRGTTIKFKATLADGTTASLRPAQENEAGYFRADVAAYRLSRVLGLGTVPPSCLRTMPRAALFGAVRSVSLAARVTKEVQWDARGESVPVSMVVWVEHLREGVLDKDVAAWRPLLLQSRALGAAPPRLQSYAAEGSRLAVWDFLIANWDRWSGGNTFRIGAQGPWVWLDNAAGFGRYTPPVRRYNEAQLRSVERYSRAFITALRQVSPDELTAALSPAGLPPHALRHLLERRDVLLRRVDALVARYGEDRVLCFE
jgi:hypothetical protein